MNKETAIHLLPFLPAFSKWQWSSDSTKLLLQHTEFDGANLLRISLEEVPQQVNGELADFEALSLNQNHIVLDEQKGNIVSQKIGPIRESLQILNFNGEKINEEPLAKTNLQKIGWDTATQQVILAVESSNQLNIQNLADEPLVEVSGNVIKDAYSKITGNEVSLENFMRSTSYALSPSREQVAMTFLTGIYLFECK